MDEPPVLVVSEVPSEPSNRSHSTQARQSSRDLPTHIRDDGSIVIDLTPLSPPPQHCVEQEPDPFNPTILVCRKAEPDPRLGPDYGPTADEVLFASAVPRARLKLSDHAEAQANSIKKSVGGFDADGGEVRVKIDF